MNAAVGTGRARSGFAVASRFYHNIAGRARPVKTRHEMRGTSRRRPQERAMRVDSCPSEEQLHAFQLGQLPQPALDEVADHLEGCPHCETVARRLDTAIDPLLAAIRQDTSTSAVGQKRPATPQD